MGALACHYLVDCTLTTLLVSGHVPLASLIWDLVFNFFTPDIEKPDAKQNAQL